MGALYTPDYSHGREGKWMRRRSGLHVEPFHGILIDKRLVGVDDEGNAVFAIEGGADTNAFHDTRVPPNIADLGSITLTTTQKMLWAPGASCVTILPANYWTETKTVRLWANIKWTAVANTNAITVGMAYGSGDAAAVNVVSNAMTAVSSTTTFDVTAMGVATCRLRGGSATLSMWGSFWVPTGLSTGGPGNFPVAGVTVVSTFDSTVASNALQFQAQRATASGDGIVVTNLLMEALN